MRLSFAFALVACGSPEGRSTRDELVAEAPPELASLGGDLADDAEDAEEATLAPEPPNGIPGPWTEERTVESAAYAVAGAPSVIVHAPASFDAIGPLRLVIFLHGWTGCARQLAYAGEVRCRDGEETAREGWGLDDRFDEAEADALFVLPQLAFLARDGGAGRFDEAGRFAAFLEETLEAIAERVGPDGLARVESITLLAHSAGFETALAVLARGGVDDRIGHVVLFDALYRGVEPFGEWVCAEPGRRLVSITTGGRTATQSQRLGRWARARLGDALVTCQPPAQPPGQPPGEAARGLPELVRDLRVVIAPSDAPHGLVPARHLAELVRALLDAPQTPSGQVCSPP